MGRTYTNLGKFELASGTLRVSDPSYAKNVWCAGIIPYCKQGPWSAAVVRSDEGAWGLRNAMLVAYATSDNEMVALADQIDEYGDFLPESRLRICGFEVGVDSGTCGIFDDLWFGLDEPFVDIYKDDPEPPEHYGSLWIDYCYGCANNGLHANVIPYGVVSSSGFGDGGYTAYSHADKDGKVDFVAIQFIPEAE